MQQRPKAIKLNRAVPSTRLPVPSRPQPIRISQAIRAPKPLRPHRAPPVWLDIRHVNYLAPTFKYKGLTFINNSPRAINAFRAEHVLPFTIPILWKVWRAVEQVTGFRWRCTSLVRDSPSHRKGHSLDIVPEFDSTAQATYSVSRMSDPVMHSRPWLLHRLLTLRNVRFSQHADILIAVESDHLHIQVVRVGFGIAPTNILRWLIPKPIYRDTHERIAAFSPKVSVV